MKVIVIKNPDGTCAVTHPCPDARGTDVRPGLPVVSKKTGKITHLPGDVYGADGTLAVRGLGREETEEEFLTRVANHVASGREWRIADADALPADRTFRNAWTDDLDTDTVDVDMGRARDVHRAALRRARKSLLEALDVEFIRAVEDGDAQAVTRIAARKKQLRDVTKHPEIEAAETPDDLKAAGFSVLAG